MAGRNLPPGVVDLSHTFAKGNKSDLVPLGDAARKLSLHRFVDRGKGSCELAAGREIQTRFKGNQDRPGPIKPLPRRFRLVLCESDPRDIKCPAKLFIQNANQLVRA